jgi:hypothetical protein
VEGTLRLGRPGTVRRANLAERDLGVPLTPVEAPDQAQAGHAYRFTARPNEIVTFSIAMNEVRSE